MIKIGSLNIDKIYLGINDDVEVYLGNVKLYPTTPPSFDVKYKFTLTDDSVVSGECDASSAITSAETSDYTASLKELVIGDCVTSIDESAFAYCNILTSIEIPDTVTSISNGVFYNCTSLTSIVIPDSVTSIGGGAFSQCNSLENIVIPSGVTSIGDYAFYRCFSLTSITVNAITPPTLGNGAFNNANDCPILVPIESINAYKTAWSTYADRIEPNNAKFYAEYSNSSTYKEQCDGTLTLATADTRPVGYQYTAMTRAEIGSCVNTIGSDAFNGCKKLSSITIPNTVTSIGSTAFANCNGLKSCTIGSGVTSIGVNAFRLCTRLTSINIPDSVTSIGDYAFYGCSSITSIDMPNGVTSIGKSAFYNCTSLKTATIGSGVTSIGNSAFERCSSLTSITVNRTTPPALGSAALNSTNNCPIFVPLESIELYRAASGWSTYSARIKPINTKFYAKYSDSSTYAAECDSDGRLLSADTKPSGYVASSMTRAEIGCTVTTIGTDAFRDCSGLTRVNSNVEGVFNIPNGITTIETSALRSCVSATTINLPSSIRSIRESAFRYCISLTSITIPSGVTSISNDTFNGCRNLSSIVIHDRVTSIGNSGFCSCSAATSISIGSGVTSIGQFAFGRITGVTNVIIPSGVTSIGQTAFKYCTNLSSVTVNATTPPTLGSDAFANTKSNLVIYVPSGSVNTYKSASGWSTYASKIQAIP